MKKSLLLIGLLVSLNANANLIVNGGFESYSVASGTAAHINSAAATCPSNINVACIQNNPAFGWQPSTGSPNEFLEVRNNFVGTAQEGTNFAELTPSDLSGITQSFNASAGTGLLSWWDKGRNTDPGDVPTNWNYQVFLNDISIFNGATAQFNDWTNRSFVVDLLDGSNTLTFRALAPLGVNALGAQIDNISLTQTTTTAVPEPETYGMMMLGLAMLGFASRRRKA